MKYWREKTVNLEFYPQQKCFSKQGKIHDISVKIKIEQIYGQQTSMTINVK